MSPSLRKINLKGLTRSQVNCAFLSALMVLAYHPAFGNGHGDAPPAAEHGAAPAAEAGHGGGAKEGEASQKKPWLEVQNQLSGFKTKRNQTKASIAKLTEEKKHIHPGSPELKEKNAELAKAYSEYKEASEEYNRLLVIFKYRFPERLVREEKRKYEPVEVQTQKELESQMDLDGRLNKVMRRARTQYGVNPEQKNRMPSSQTEDDTLKTLFEQDSVLLQK